MKMEVEITSKELIEPSSSTPHDLKTHKLSFLDLYLPPFYVPVLLYFPFNQTSTNLSVSSDTVDSLVSERLQLLKKSLSETLSLFYPLAGKIKDYHSVECSDEGAYFAEARVKASGPSLSEFLTNLDISLIKNFLPEGAKWCNQPIVGNFLIGVQVTRFSCGGIVLGVYASHMVIDGASLSLFLKTWAARFQKNSSNYNGDDQSSPLLACSPKFDGPSLFPQSEAYPREVCLSPLFFPSNKQGKCASGRIVFDASAIAKLKAKATSSGVQNPTRIEVVTSLLYKCIVSALKGRPCDSADDHKPYLINHAVNMRRKATPTFSDYQIGNFVCSAYALCEKEEAAELHAMTCKLREAVGKINGDFVKNLLLQGGEGLFNLVEAVKHEREACGAAADRIAFSSWCNFGFYDLDFGWGKPAWASILDFSEWTDYVMNMVILMDSKAGNGVEAWVLLSEEDMAKLQVDAELLEFATLNPNHGY